MGPPKIDSVVEEFRFHIRSASESMARVLVCRFFLREGKRSKGGGEILSRMKRQVFLLPEWAEESMQFVIISEHGLERI